MQKLFTRVGFVAALLSLLLFLRVAPAVAQYDVEKSVLASGGGAMGSASFGVSGTTGQLGAGSLAGENFSAVTGFWRITQNVATAIEELPGIPRVFALEQNYPNPFNPQTTIEFALPRDSVVRLSIFDASGRLVDELVNERREAGVYREVFAAPSLASGIYFYRMETDELVRTRKLVLLK